MGLDVQAFSQQEWITAVTFALMVAGWIFGNRPAAQYDHVAFMGFGVLLFLGVITFDDITRAGILSAGGATIFAAHHVIVGLLVRQDW